MSYTPTPFAPLSDAALALCRHLCLLPTGTMAILCYIAINEAYPNDWRFATAFLITLFLWSVAMWASDRAHTERCHRRYQRDCARYGTISRITP